MGLLLSLLTQDQNLLQDPNSILPLVFLKNKKTDLPSLYLILSTMRNQCMSQAEMTNLFLTYILLDNTIEDQNEGNDVIIFNSHAVGFSNFERCNLNNSILTSFYRLLYSKFFAEFRNNDFRGNHFFDMNVIPFLRNEFRKFLSSFLQ